MRPLWPKTVEVVEDFYIALQGLGFWEGARDVPAS